MKHLKHKSTSSVAMEGLLDSIKDIFGKGSRRKDRESVESEETINIDLLNKLIDETIGDSSWMSKRTLKSGEVSGLAIVPYLAVGNKWDPNTVRNLKDLAAFMNGCVSALEPGYKQFAAKMIEIYKELGNQDPGDKAGLKKAWLKANAEAAKLNHPAIKALALMKDAEKHMGGMKTEVDKHGSFNPTKYEALYFHHANLVTTPTSIPALSKDQILELAHAIKGFADAVTYHNSKYKRREFNLGRVEDIRYSVPCWKDGEVMKGTRVGDDQLYHAVSDNYKEIIWSYDAELHQYGDPLFRLTIGLEENVDGVVKAIFRWINRSIVD